VAVRECEKEPIVLFGRIQNSDRAPTKGLRFNVGVPPAFRVHPEFPDSLLVLLKFFIDALRTVFSKAGFVFVVTPGWNQWRS
jgi:hypothetical protein